MQFTKLAVFFAIAFAVAAQDPPKTDVPKQDPAPTAEIKPAADQAKTFQVDTGTRVPLALINSVSTKHAAPGDKVYLETVFPIVVNGKVVIPPGSYVAGTITQVQRPGKVKGRGEFYLRFDSLTLPNGVTRDFRATISGLDGRANEELDRAEGKVKSEGNKSGDARTVAETTSAGASAGGLIGLASGRPGMGAGIGAAAGAAAGLAAVLFTRGPDAVLAKGTTVEMVLDRPIKFDDAELDFSNSPAARRGSSDGPGPLPSKKTGGVTGRRWPL
jgi:type IV secretion system protein VirB10